MPFPSTATAAAAFAVYRRALKSLQIPEGDAADFEEIGDQQARGPAEQLQELSNQTASILALGDGRLGQVSVADFLHLARSPLWLEPVHERLSRGVGDALVLGQTLEDFAHRAGSQFPALLQ